MVERRSDDPRDADDPLGRVYDAVELARIDRTWLHEVDDADPEAPPLGLIDGGNPAADEPLPPVPRYPVARRFGITGAMLAGAMTGLAEVLEPERARQHLIEFAPDRLDENEQPVTFHLVVGSPRESRLVIRPWLADRLRRS
jgi:hypothetical protein